MDRLYHGRVEGIWRPKRRQLIAEELHAARLALAQQVRFFAQPDDLVALRGVMGCKVAVLPREILVDEEQLQTGSRSARRR
jgi:hypothetical protein